MQCCFLVAPGSGPCDVDPPGLTIVEPEFLLSLIAQEIEGAFDVLGGEGLAVVPLDAFAQLEAELGAVLAPCPARGELRHDRCQAVLRDMLVEQNEVVEYPHHRHHYADRPFFVDRHAGGAVAVIDTQDPALLLRQCRVGGAQRNQRHAQYCKSLESLFRLSSSLKSLGLCLLDAGSCGWNGRG